MISALRLLGAAFLVNWALYLVVFGAVTVVMVLGVVPTVGFLKTGTFQLMPIASMVTAFKAVVSSSAAVAGVMAVWTLVENKRGAP